MNARQKAKKYKALLQKMRETKVPVFKVDTYEPKAIRLAENIDRYMDNEFIEEVLKPSMRRKLADGLDEYITWEVEPTFVSDCNRLVATILFLEKG